MNKYATGAQQHRVYRTERGVDFATNFVAGLERFLADTPAEIWARCTIIVNTARLHQRIVGCLSHHSGFLPRIYTIDHLHSAPLFMLPLLRAARPLSASSSLGRQMQTMRFIKSLIDQGQQKIPRTALFDLSAQLTECIDELICAGIDNRDLDNETALPPLVGIQKIEHSRTLLRIVWDYLDRIGALSAEGYHTFQRRTIDTIIAHWQDNPPNHPVIIAGSTGSQSSTRTLMGAIARLTQGRVVLPALDIAADADLWHAAAAKTDMGQSKTMRDHPQYRLYRFLQSIGIQPRDVPLWHAHSASISGRNQLVSLALCPAPVTDRWLSTGKHLPCLESAMAGCTLIEANTAWQEAYSIAIACRRALEQKHSVTCVTADRTLAARIKAALGYWQIQVDDGIGAPLQHNALGQLVVLSISALHRTMTMDGLLALLKNPLVCAGNQHTQQQHKQTLAQLEAYWQNSTSLTYGTASVQSVLDAFVADNADNAECVQHSAWIKNLVTALGLYEQYNTEHTIEAWGQLHCALLDALLGYTLATLCQSPPSPSPLPQTLCTDQHNAFITVCLQTLRQLNPHPRVGDPASILTLYTTVAAARKTDQLLRSVIDNAVLERKGATTGITLNAYDYSSFITRYSAQPHFVLRTPSRSTAHSPQPQVLLRQPWEIRNQISTVMILCGLNEGTWPTAAPPDPWLDRGLRYDLNMNTPEDDLGNAAHDFEHALCAQNVILTRTIEHNNRATVPARWLNRLVHILDGLHPNSRAALDQTRARGRALLDWARMLETGASAAAVPVHNTATASAPRPCPAPPLAARPTRFSITDIQTLSRNPYEIYVRKVLRLRALHRMPTTRFYLERGKILHTIFERFFTQSYFAFAGWNRPQVHKVLFNIAEQEISKRVPIPSVRTAWLWHFEHILNDCLDYEEQRQKHGMIPHLCENKGEIILECAGHNITLHGRIDRIDTNHAQHGHKDCFAVAVYDYKSGTAPPTKADLDYDHQLPLAAVILAAGGVNKMPSGALQITHCGHIGVGNTAYYQTYPMDKHSIATTRDQVIALIAWYHNQQQGYLAGRVPRVQRTTVLTDYDHLARFGEWTYSDPAHVHIVDQPTPSNT